MLYQMINLLNQVTKIIIRFLIFMKINEKQYDVQNAEAKVLHCQNEQEMCIIPELHRKHKSIW